MFFNLFILFLLRTDLLEDFYLHKLKLMFKFLSLIVYITFDVQLLVFSNMFLLKSNHNVFLETCCKLKIIKNINSNSIF